MYNQINLNNTFIIFISYRNSHIMSKIIHFFFLSALILILSIPTHSKITYDNVKLFFQYTYDQNNDG